MSVKFLFFFSPFNPLFFSHTSLHLHSPIPQYPTPIWFRFCFSPSFFFCYPQWAEVPHLNGVWYFPAPSFFLPYFKPTSFTFGIIHPPLLTMPLRAMRDVCELRSGHTRITVNCGFLDPALNEGGGFQKHQQDPQVEKWKVCRVRTRKLTSEAQRAVLTRLYKVSDTDVCYQLTTDFLLQMEQNRHTKCLPTATIDRASRRLARLPNHRRAIQSPPPNPTTPKHEPALFDTNPGILIPLNDYSAAKDPHLDSFWRTKQKRPKRSVSPLALK